MKAKITTSAIAVVLSIETLQRCLLGKTKVFLSFN